MRDGISGERVGSKMPVMVRGAPYLPPGDYPARYSSGTELITSAQLLLHHRRHNRHQDNHREKEYPARPAEVPDLTWLRLYS